MLVCGWSNDDKSAHTHAQTDRHTQIPGPPQTWLGRACTVCCTVDNAPITLNYSKEWTLNSPKWTVSLCVSAKILVYIRPSPCHWCLKPKLRNAIIRLVVLLWVIAIIIQMTEYYGLSCRSSHVSNGAILFLLFSHSTGWCQHVFIWSFVSCFASKLYAIFLQQRLSLRINKSNKKKKHSEIQRDRCIVLRPSKSSAELLFSSANE